MLYSVTGPERSEKIVVCDDGTGPLEYFNDWYLVDAPTKKAAAWAAFNRAKENKDSWWADLDVDYEHPLKGIKIDVIEDELEEEWLHEVGQRYYVDARSTKKKRL